MGRVGRRGGLAGRPAGPAPACRRGIDPGLSGTLGADARAMVEAYTADVNAYLRNYPAPPECGWWQVRRSHGRAGTA